MYKKRTLKNGNIKLENSRRTKYAIFSRRDNMVTFNAGLCDYVVKQFERQVRR